MLQVHIRNIQETRRFLTYKTREDGIILVEQGRITNDEDWELKNHIMLPENMVQIVDGYREDISQLPLAVRKILFYYECKCVPCCPNQLQVWDEVEKLEDKWLCKDIESPIQTPTVSSGT